MKVGVCFTQLGCNQKKLQAHKREGESNYMCVLCGENFDKPINLRQHKQFKHGINPPTTLPMEITPPRGAPLKYHPSDPA